MGKVHAVIVLMADVGDPFTDPGHARQRLQAWLDENTAGCLRAAGFAPAKVKEVREIQGFQIQGFAYLPDRPASLDS